MNFEWSKEVIGIGLWRGPEILQQMKDSVPGSEMQITGESDVYSYAMICYEIVTRHTPFGYTFVGCNSLEGSHENLSSCIPF